MIQQLAFTGSSSPLHAEARKLDISIAKASCARYMIQQLALTGSSSHLHAEARQLDARAHGGTVSGGMEGSTGGLER